MTERSLWTSYIGPPTTYTEGGPVTMGVSFVPSVDGLVTALKWYRGSTGAGIIPQRLALWNRTTGNKIAEVVSPTDNNVVGWKQYDLVTPAALAQGLTYSVTFDVAGSVTAYRHVNGTPPLPDTNLAWSSNMRAYHSGAQNTYPNSVDNFGGNLVDIVFDDAGTGPPPDDPATAADVEAIMASWLTLGAGNDHVGQLPNQTYEAITNTSSGLPSISEAIADLSTDVLKADSAVITAIQSKLDGIDAIAQGILGPSGTVFTGLLRTFLNGLQTDINTTLALAASVRGVQTIQAGPSVPGWVLVDEGTFGGPFTVDLEMDRLTVVADDWGANRRTNVFGGLEFFTEPFWWVPLRGGAVAGRHYTFMATAVDLYEAASQRMGGAFVKVAPDVSGTWQAWRYDGP